LFAKGAQTIIMAEKNECVINAKSYDKIAGQWAQVRGKHLPGSLIVNFATKLKPLGEVLDIGCGTGYPIASYLSQRGFHVTGIDVSENMVQKAIEQGIPNARFFLCDFYDYKPDRCYDGVVAFDSFFHFPKQRQREIYQKVSAWMREGAYLLFTHGKEDSEIEGSMFGESFYYSALETQEVHRLLLQAGFSIELSVKGYREGDNERDLVIVAKKQ